MRSRPPIAPHQTTQASHSAPVSFLAGSLLSSRGLLWTCGLLFGCSETEPPQIPGTGTGSTFSSTGASSGGGLDGADANQNGGSGGQLVSGGASSGGTAWSAGGSGEASSGGTDGGGGTAAGSGGESARADGYELIWADEFDGSDIDSGKWEHEVDCWGGGNNEDQCYVTAAKNAFVEGGALHIVALADAPSGPEGGESGSDAIVSRGHSSARLRTLNQGDFLYGRIEARLKLPFGQGLWPAFWMLPTDNVYGGWAASGEIDILEAVNLNPDNQVHGTLHYGAAWPDNESSGTSFTSSTNAWQDFHLYAVEWEEGEIRWFVDETHYQTQTSWNSTAAPFPAPFDERFHIILNIAVGGAWPGPPDETTTFPQEMLVDYVRVYECALDPVTGHGCGSRDPQIQPL